MEEFDLFGKTTSYKKECSGKQEGGILKKYSNPMMPTSQFPMCGNCFRMDTYHGCSFGCSYCFVNARGGYFHFDYQLTDINLVRKWFHEAIDLNETNNIKKEFLNHYVPLHLGGLSDPFQPIEWKYERTYEFLKLSKEYNYPVNISTKTAHLPDKYWDVLDPNIHTFSISLMGWSDDYIRKWESKTPLAKERASFIKKLKESGFWVGVRIQPVIDIKEAEAVVLNTQEYVDYYTLEHLKIALDNKEVRDELLRKITGLDVRLIPKGREYEFDIATKIANIQRIKDITNVKIGCGDNDLHTMSDSLNCCGIDTMTESFKNWFKYNSMYIKMTGDRSQWSPKSNCNNCFNGACVKKGFSTMKQYTDRYYNEQYGDDAQLLLFD